MSNYNDNIPLRGGVRPVVRGFPPSPDRLSPLPRRQETQDSHRSQRSASSTAVLTSADNISIDDEESIKESDSTKLDRALSERHVNMISFSCVIGVGLFLQNSRVIALAGPGMAFLSYLLMGSIVWSVQAALGEMTALFPIEGALFELPSRFLDQSIGYASGWMAWFAWAVIVAAEIDAASNLFKFQFAPAYLQALPTGPYPESELQWSPTLGVNPAVWTTMFLLAILFVNCWKVRWFGELEYIFGVLKMLFFVGLILFQFIIHIQLAVAFKYYQKPWGFVARSFVSSTNHEYGGGWGRLMGVWSAMTLTIFSMIGMEAVSITASENKHFNTEEGIKLSTRKISTRVIILYTLSTFIVGLNIPYDDPAIIYNGTAGLGRGTSSAFVVAAVHAHKKVWPSFMNGFFIFSAFSCGCNSLYLASRLLHALALSKDAWPKLLGMRRSRDWLARTTKRKVPRNAVIVCWLFGLLAYLSAGSSPEQGLGRLAINSTVSMLITYAVICATYLKFFSRIRDARLGKIRNDGVVNDLNRYNRDAPDTYPYRSHWQKPRTYFALFGCTIMALLNGWRAFSPFDAGLFIASYISVIVFLVLVITFRFTLNGKAAWNWEFYPSRSESLADPNKLEPGSTNFGRDRLNIDKEDSWSWGNVKEVFRLAWVLVK